MTSSELEFTAEELFKAHYGPMGKCAVTADSLNAILAEKLKKCPVVYGEIWSGNLGMLCTVKQSTSTQQAYLVGIAPIKGATDSESPIKGGEVIVHLPKYNIGNLLMPLCAESYNSVNWRLRQDDNAKHKGERWCKRCLKKIKETK